jgi:hypothetical protein
MGFLNWLLGKNDQDDEQQRRASGNDATGNRGNYGNQPGGYNFGGQQTRDLRNNPQYGDPNAQPQMTDEQAVSRYRYLLRTAPPETIEQAHAEAFSQLTPEQRRTVLQQLSANVPPQERPASDDPQSLARAATRAEMRQPGTIERTFANMPPSSGIGMGGLMAGSFFSSMAGMFVGSMIANSFFGGPGFDQGYSEGYSEGQNAGAEGDAQGDGGADQGDAGNTADTGGQGYDAHGDPGYGSGGYESGGFEQGDYASDFGGDFGGGDFGGDFG